MASTQYDNKGMEPHMARVVSVNVGKPKQVEQAGRSVITSIFKTAVEGPRRVHGHNIEGDRQADLRVHGGPYKAIYLYPEEHYSFWKGELGLETLEYGAFGENLTTRGVLEGQVRIGDQFRIGSTILQVTQPRMPCFKLQVRFGKSDMVRKFWESCRSGMYFSIKQEGILEAGNEIEKVSEGPEAVTVMDVVRLYKGEEWRDELRNRALRAPLYGGWKAGIQSRLVEK